MESEHVVISNLTKTIDRCYEVIETFMFDVRFEKKSETKLRLLAEETLTFLKDIVDGIETIFWIQGDKNNCDLVFLCKKQLTPEKKAELLSMSSTGKNTSYTGIKGIIKGFFANPDEPHGDGVVGPWTSTSVPMVYPIPIASPIILIKSAAIHATAHCQNTTNTAHLYPSSLFTAAIAATHGV